jgi:hypothetical protein
MNWNPSPAPGAPDRDPAYKPRRSPRMAVTGSAVLRSDDLYDVEVRVRNVSTCGFMAQCAVPVRIGSYVSLDVPGIGPVHAQVRWQIGFTMGGMFLDPISLDRCEWTATRAASPIVDV